MYTLGINAAFHDSAACIIKDGQLLAATEEERFTHVKHGKRPVPFSTWELPYHAIDYCLGAARIDLVDVDPVAYSLDPDLMFDRRKQDRTVPIPLRPGPNQPVAAGFESPWDP